LRQLCFPLWYVPGCFGRALGEQSVVLLEFRGALRDSGVFRPKTSKKKRHGWNHQRLTANRQL
jgi:hypothetical protein